ncbi:PAS-domain containing protein [Sulfitobacter sp. HNIBRBA2951]|uniref:PAS-domain containing protein n=1 Tax=Sulfitobacter aquimarinus TaxID=3158557 RepID=UPI0032DE39FC
MRPQTAARDDNSADLPFIVFRNDVLDYASDPALARFPIAIGAHSWADMHDILFEAFPGFPAKAPVSADQNLVISCALDPRRKLTVEWIPNGASLSFIGLTDEPNRSEKQQELDNLRQINTHVPYPIWKTDQAGEIVWQNAAYNAIGARHPHAPMPLFDTTPMSAAKTTIRAKVGDKDVQEVEWYEVTRTPLPEGTLYSATSLDPLIRAEDAQREFVQTLAKTFAHLSVGLAVFNRDRQLALFNPALIDLSGLSVSFLSPRPTIDSFFDAMRENRRMPEPKNYKTWRQRIADLIDDAENGRFEETWTLETGQTYSVKGRPHPDGAIAFLLEDISAEISLARNFRAELELGQNLVDTFEDALAVFSQSGMLTFSNKAFDTMWKFDAGTSFADVTIHDAIQLWKEQSEANPLWQDIHDAVMTLGERETWTMPVCIKGQTPMQCKIVPIASGATVIRFSQQQRLAQVKSPILKRNSG